MKKYIRVLTFLAMILLLQACGRSPKEPQIETVSYPSVPQSPTQPIVSGDDAPASSWEISTPVFPTLQPVAFVVSVDPSQQGQDDPAVTPTPTLAQNIGSDTLPEGVNPLTGKPVTQKENLDLPPALVSIANWPPSVRPQAGLSFSPLVFELYIGEGMTRFLALFYGDFPQEKIQSSSSLVKTDSSEIGPIRSGRLPYESLRKFYNGFLVMASAYAGVAQNLETFNNVFGENSEDVNSAMISVTRLEDIARSYRSKINPGELSGMTFDKEVPANGVPANQLLYFVSYLDQILWKYDPEMGTYLRSQNGADVNSFIQASDRLSGDPLAFENVIVLFVNHRYCTEQAFDLDIMYINQQKALVFRDGNVYPVLWSTKNEEYEQQTGKLRPIRFQDPGGNPFTLKPGRTWVHIVPLNTPYWETENTLDYYRLFNNRQPGSGNWAMRFYTENMEYDVAVCEKLRPE